MSILYVVETPKHTHINARYQTHTTIRRVSHLLPRPQAATDDHMSKREVLTSAHTPNGIIDDTLHEVLDLNEKGYWGTGKNK